MKLNIKIKFIAKKISIKEGILKININLINLNLYQLEHHEVLTQVQRGYRHFFPLFYTSKYSVLI